MKIIGNVIRLAALPLALCSGVAQAALFEVNWSGAQFGNAATATGTFDFTADAADLGGNQPFRSFPDGRVSLASLSVTQNGSTTSFSQSDFSSFYFASNSQLDFSRELIGQTMTNGCTFGSFASPCYGGSSGDFNLFSSNSAAPTGSFYFVLTAAGGNQLAVISMAPGAGAVPEPATWAMLILGFGAVGAALRRRKVQSAYHFA